MGRLVCGVGLNDACYSTSKFLNGKQIRCPIYRKWHDMLRRCYSKKYQDRQPTYIGCSVCEEWLTFSNFKAWMEKQAWEGKDLDKDLLVSGNKEYRPDVCMFVTSWINKLITDHGAKRGAYPIGVSLFKRDGNFRADVNAKGIAIRLGRFPTPQNAHAAWQKAKIAIIRETAEAESDVRLVSALHRIADKVQSDLDAGVETKSF